MSTCRFGPILRFPLILAVLGIAGVVSPARAQGFDVVQTPWGPGRNLGGQWFRSIADPLPAAPFRIVGKDWSLAFGGQYLVRLESRTNRDFSASRDDLDTFTQQRARFTLRASYAKRIGVYLEFQDVRTWGSETSVVSVEPFTGLHQGFADLRLEDWVQIRAGRQELAYGQHRLIGNLDWSNIGRAFDGVWMRFGSKPLSADLFGMVVRERKVLTSGTTSVTNEGAQFYGLYLRWRSSRRWGIDLYGLGFVNDPSSPAGGQGADLAFATAGGRAFGRIGPLLLVGEGAYQFGSAPDGDVLAWAMAAQARVALPLPMKPYVAFEYARASGDGTQGDRKHTTFNQLFPTGHAHHGFIDYVGWQNMQSYHLRAGARPWGAHLWVDVFRFELVESRGAWYHAGGGEFIPADPRRSHLVMGTEVDISLTVPIHKMFALATAYTVFVPGAAAGVAPGSTIGKGGAVSHWGFLYLRSQF